MKIFHVEPFTTQPLPSIAAVGNFDGMHIGHQTILKQLIAKACEEKLASTVIFFEPQPQEFFNPQKAPARIQTFREKIETLKALKIDQVICLRFDQSFATLSPAEFLHRLKTHYQVQALFVGRDFCFGKNREGNLEYLKNAKENFFEMPDVEESAARVSSTRIREHLQRGELTQASHLLGRHCSITGKVIHGAKRGRLLDFPTANIFVDRLKSPVHGVYIVCVVLENAQRFFGAANVGCRPTVSQEDKWFLEVFLFTDQALDLYGYRIRVEFLHKIRDEQHFDSLQALQTQIKADVTLAQCWLADKGLY